MKLERSSEFQVHIITSEHVDLNSIEKTGFSKYIQLAKKLKQTFSKIETNKTTKLTINAKLDRFS